jgi:sedoheptulose-bisphosphatase
VITNAHFFRALSACGAVATAASEEASTPAPLGGAGFSVAFDPLDGSSVLDAGFAVGSIVGVWPGSELVGRCGRQQVAACYALYGPRTLLVLAAAGLPGGVNEYVLTSDGGEHGAAAGAPASPRAAASAAPAAAARWRLSREALRVTQDSARVFAPANARAAADNAAYRTLLHGMLDAKLTIRYRREPHARHARHARTLRMHACVC